MCQTARTVICTKCRKPYDSEDSTTLECPVCEAGSEIISTPSVNGSAVIPAMTNDLGRYWDQPELDSFVVDDVRAYMRSETFDQLRDYSGTFPSGVYPGKMWKRRIDYYDPSQGWLLCWYADHPTDPEKCVVDHRRIFIEPEARQ